MNRLVLPSACGALTVALLLAATTLGDVEGVVRGVSGIADAKVDLVWDPPWTPDRMTEAARLELGMM